VSVTVALGGINLVFRRCYSRDLKGGLYFGAFLRLLQQPENDVYPQRKATKIVFFVSCFFFLVVLKSFKQKACPIN